MNDEKSKLIFMVILAFTALKSLVSTIKVIH